MEDPREVLNDFNSKYTRGKLVTVKLGYAVFPCTIHGGAYESFTGGIQVSVFPWGDDKNIAVPLDSILEYQDE